MDNFQNNNVKNNNVDNYNFKDKVNHKFSKVKENLSKSNSERENFEERTKISNLINEAENKKSSLLIEMGILTYQKIREGYIKIEDFDSLSNSLLELDKYIYDRSLELNKLKKKNVTNDCECGNKIKGQDRFCSVCGKKVDDLDDRNMIICEFCDSEIEEDSNYCVCCGKKVIFM